MNRHVNSIAGRLSLRPPQRDSLAILDRLTEIVPPKKSGDAAAALAIIRSEYMRCARDSCKIDLDSVTTLKRAYQVVGVLLPPVEERRPGPEKPTVEFIRNLDQFRVWFNRRTRSLPLRRWSPEARRLLRNELTWFKNLHDQLSDA
jgi:hypothetical protein